MPHVDIAARMLRRQEGLRLQVYDDRNGTPIGPTSLVAGHPTIGYGRALDVRGISLAEAEFMLASDLREAEKSAIMFAGPGWVDLSPARRAVLMSLAHQLGARGLNGFSQLRLAVHSGDHATAAAEILDSKLGRIDAPNRAQELAEVMRTGIEFVEV